MLNLLQRILEQRKARRYAEYRQWFQAARLAEDWTAVKCPACHAPVANLQANFCWQCGSPLSLQGDNQTEPMESLDPHTSGYIPVASPSDARVTSLIRTQYSMPRVPKIESIRSRAQRKQMGKY